MLQVLLRDYEFESASSFEKALRLIDAGEYDLYIFDNWMPGGTGVELCRRVRELGSKRPIIFVSGVARREDIEEALASGADRYLTKPCEPALLRQVVKELLAETPEAFI